LDNNVAPSTESMSVRTENSEIQRLISVGTCYITEVRHPVQNCGVYALVHHQVTSQRWPSYVADLVAFCLSLVGPSATTFALSIDSCRNHPTGPTHTC